MNQSKLPNLRGTTDRAPASCSKCGGDSFETSLGIGKLFWNGGVGGRVVLDDPDDGARLATSVTCVKCKKEHTPLIDPPEPRSRNS